MPRPAVLRSIDAMKAAQFGKDDAKRALRFALDHDWGGARIWTGTGSAGLNTAGPMKAGGNTSAPFHCPPGFAICGPSAGTEEEP